MAATFAQHIGTVCKAESPCHRPRGAELARTAAHADLRWAATGKRASADAHRLVAGGTSPTMVEVVARDLAATHQLLSRVSSRQNESGRLAPVAGSTLAAQPVPSLAGAQVRGRPRILDDRRLYCLTKYQGGTAR